MKIRLKEILKEKKIFQNELSERTNLSIVAINNIALNSELSNPTIKTLQKIADALDITVQDLFETDQKNITPIYIKDRNDIERVVGYIDLDKIGFIFKG